MHTELINSSKHTSPVRETQAYMTNVEIHLVNCRAIRIRRRNCTKLSVSRERVPDVTLRASAKDKNPWKEENHWVEKSRNGAR